MNLIDDTDPVSNERDELFNKWKDKTHEDLLKKAVESDLFVKTILKEKEELTQNYLKQRDELVAKAKFEELVDRFEKLPNTSSMTPVTEDGPKYNPKEVEDIVSRKIQETKIAERENHNFSLVESKLREKYGDGYKSIVKEQQQSLGLSPDDINNLAKKSPDAFFKMLGLDQQKTDSFQTPPRSDRRSDTFAPTGQPKRNYAYYQDLAKANPKVYLDPKISKQMDADAIAMGEAFFQ